jgi:hypothetical protein
MQVHWYDKFALNTRTMPEFVVDPVARSLILFSIVIFFITVYNIMLKKFVHDLRQVGVFFLPTPVSSTIKPLECNTIFILSDRQRY